MFKIPNPVWMEKISPNFIFSGLYHILKGKGTSLDPINHEETYNITH